MTENIESHLSILEDHEKRLKKNASKIGETGVSLSHDLAAVQKSQVKIRENITKVGEKLSKFKAEMKKAGTGARV